MKQMSSMEKAMLFLPCVLTILAAIGYFFMEMREGPLINAGFISGAYLSGAVMGGMLKLERKSEQEE